MSTPLKIGVVGGGGWLGKTIIQAMLANGVICSEQLGISYRSRVPQDIKQAHVTSDSQALADLSETVILSVRPADWPQLSIDARGKFLISVMAGLSIDSLAGRTGAVRIVRAMPNVAASVGYSFTPWVATPETTREDRALVRHIFGSCGLCDEVGSEEELDYLTGLTGSGPAYPALLAEALRSHAVLKGIRPDVAERAVTALLIGTGRLLERDPQPTQRIVEDFVEYKGVIAAAINAMQATGFESAVDAGLEAALVKSRSMGRPA